MNNIETDLFALAYTIFPKGLSDRSEDYLKSAEYENLCSFIKTKEKASFAFEQLGLGIINSNVGCDFENLSDILIQDRCLKGKFYLKSHTSPCLLIYISIVIPYYIIYQPYQRFLPKSIQDMNDSKFFISDIIEENKALNNQIAIQTENFFPGYEHFPIELLNTEVSDIVFNGNGKLLSFEKSKFSNPMTFFNVFFSDTYF